MDNNPANLGYLDFVTVADASDYDMVYAWVLSYDPNDNSYFVEYLTHEDLEEDDMPSGHWFHVDRVNKTDAPADLKVWKITDDYLAIVRPNGKLTVGCQVVDKDVLADIIAFMGQKQLI